MSKKELFDFCERKKDSPYEWFDRQLGEIKNHSRIFHVEPKSEFLVIEIRYWKTNYDFWLLAWSLNSGERVVVVGVKRVDYHYRLQFVGKSIDLSETYLNQGLESKKIFMTVAMMDFGGDSFCGYLPQVDGDYLISTLPFQVVAESFAECVISAPINLLYEYRLLESRSLRLDPE
ncbi:predicted protein [Sclerotinia sclerotiorum 1980 UF-70]|uniref:Uncharacterized protein n=1 Tax=Sclerotinia sclerotiorum (strain ATCC 18683 / 1980 / Ss-1) TaxID=665079 RepID=A7EKK3_SCLS1|nr:predicted protein [Sclerotinia sclerotiorum 1980 UF-70]EDO03369.1 predicted protein [Sclerotinia sclerotiorum 1980 UF-70]